MRARRKHRTDSNACSSEPKLVRQVFFVKVGSKLEMEAKQQDAFVSQTLAMFRVVCGQRR